VFFVTAKPLAARSLNVRRIDYSELNAKPRLRQYGCASTPRPYQRVRRWVADPLVAMRFSASSGTRVPTPDAHLLTRHCCVSAAIGNSASPSSKYDISTPTNSDILRYVRVEAVHFVGTYVPDLGTC
jgi:hypothetical protein